MKTRSNDPKWYVVYTLPRAEKKVASLINELGIETFLPTSKVIKQWSDRKKKVETPLFPSYVFVKIDELNRSVLFHVKGIIRFVSIEKRPIQVREREIEMIKRIINGETVVTEDEYFQTGMTVKITAGQFSGLEGIIIKKSSSNRMLIKIDCLRKAFSFNISTMEINLANQYS